MAIIDLGTHMYKYIYMRDSVNEYNIVGIYFQ